MLLTSALSSCDAGSCILQVQIHTRDRALPCVHASADSNRSLLSEIAAKFARIQ